METPRPGPEDITNRENVESNVSMNNIAEKIKEDLACERMVPIQLIQNGGVIDFIKPRSAEASLNENPYTGEDARLEQILEIADRPFCIILAAHPQEREVILKVRTREDPEHSARNEINFLKSIAPIIANAMLVEGHRLSNRIRFPRLIKSREEEVPTLCLENYFQGRATGSIHRADIEVLTEQDIEDIADFIDFFQSERVQIEIAKVLGDTGRKLLDFFGKYSDYLSRHREKLISCVGEDHVNSMNTILSDRQNFIQSGPKIFAARDINPSNIIKTESDELAMIDWERCGVTNNPATEYGFLFVSLFSAPELQEKLLRKIKLAHQDDPDFFERFRLDFIFFRGTGELNYWLNAQMIAESDAEREICQDAIERLSQLMRDAIDKSGIWSEDETKPDKEF